MAPKKMLHRLCVLIAILSSALLVDADIERRNNSIGTDQAINGLLTVYHNLTHAQQQKLDSLIGQSVNGSSADDDSLQDKLHDFVDGLSNSVKTKINDAETTFNSVKGDVSSRVNDLKNKTLAEVDNLKNKTRGAVENVHRTVSNVSNDVQKEFERIKNKIQGNDAPEPVQQNVNPYPLTN